MTEPMGVVTSLLLAALSACAQPLYRSDFLPLPPGPAALPEWDLLDGQYGLQDGWLTVSSERSNPRALLGMYQDRERRQP